MPAAASISRRQLLRGRPLPPPFRPRPPGVTEETLAACTACGLCVEKCPENVLALRDGRVELQIGQGECSFCGDCATVCPEPVFSETKVMQHVLAITADCLAMAGISCMSCRDACPDSAISMRPRVGGPFLPVLDAASCTGCGACAMTCPSDAIVAQPKESVDEG